MATYPLADVIAPLGIFLEPVAQERLAWLAAELLRWNRTHNLTAITDPAEVKEKHLVDSLTLLPLLDHAHRLLDLGSGAGFPALPVKISRPDLEVVSVDAVSKKIAFQRHVARTLQLTGFTAVHGRAENFADNPLCAAGFDMITARALGGLPLLARLAAPLLTPAGRLIAMKGAGWETELAEGATDLGVLGFVCTAQHQFQLPVSKAERCLLVLEKTGSV